MSTKQSTKATLHKILRYKAITLSRRQAKRKEGKLALKLYDVFEKSMGRGDAAVATTIKSVQKTPPDARVEISTSAGIKVMVALSFLSNAIQLKILSLLSNLSAEVCRKASIKVIAFIEQELFPKKVLWWPTVKNGLLDSTLKEYNAAGLPGCIGSIDCTHVHWDKCPASHRSLYVGKEKFPTARLRPL